MEINFTLVIQAINFFIAYTILKYLLFSPAVAVLQEEEDYRIKSHDFLSALKQQLASGQLQMVNAWHEFMNYSKAQCPLEKDAVLFSYEDISPRPNVDSLSAQDKEQLYNELVDILINKVDHVE